MTAWQIKDLTLKIYWNHWVDFEYTPFLSDKAQLNEQEVDNTQSVASVRIHVERAISRIKMYKIITNFVPLSLAGVILVTSEVNCRIAVF